MAPSGKSASAIGHVFLLCILVAAGPLSAQSQRIPEQDAVARLNAHIDFIAARSKDMNALYQNSNFGGDIEGRLTRAGAKYTNPDSHILRWSWSQYGVGFYDRHIGVLKTSIRVIQNQHYAVKSGIDYLDRGMEAWKRHEETIRVLFEEEFSLIVKFLRQGSGYIAYREQNKFDPQKIVQKQLFWPLKPDTTDPVATKWNEPPETLGNKITIETAENPGGFDRPIVGLKYAEKSKVSLVVDGKGDDLSKAIETVAVRNLIGPSRKAVPYGRDRLQISHDDERGETLVTLDLDALLRDLPAGVNLNVLEAAVTLRLPASRDPVESKTTNLLHVLRQKLMVFLPGVLGSVLYVNEPPGPEKLAECRKLPSGNARDACLRGEEVEAYPRMTPNFFINRLRPWHTVDYLDKLENRAATKIDLFRSYGVNSGAEIDTVPIASAIGRWREPESLVYGIEKLDAVNTPPNHPKLTVNGAPTPYYIFQPWPYDWRGKLDQHVDRLMGKDSPTGSVDPPYPAPPSLASLLRAKKEKYPFLHDRAAIIAHSTGGLIIRGLLIRDGVEKLVDKAAFIDVPFYGAPKIYFSYLTGNLGVPFLGPEKMLLLAPSMPILYYLAPSKYYPESVAAETRDGIALRKLRLHLPAGMIVEGLVREARARGLYPARDDKQAPPEWNEELEREAERYHVDIRTGRINIKLKDCLVFVSTADAPTIGTVRIGEKAVEYEAIRGDGTVPLVSQLGDFAERDEVEKKPIPGSPTHTLAPNQDYVWAEIIKKLIVYP